VLAGFFIIFFFFATFLCFAFLSQDVFAIFLSFLYLCFSSATLVDSFFGGTAVQPKYPKHDSDSNDFGVFCQKLFHTNCKSKSQKPLIIFSLSRTMKS
jgi:hypothetical protein